MLTKPTQKEKADELLALHTTGKILLLPNIWNPIGARVLAAKGFAAVATASPAISASLGYQDGEKIRRSTLIDCLTRIARSVDVPVTADIEAGYGQSVPELEETIEQVIDAGVVGINIEDSITERHALRPIEQQCQRIAAVREVAERRGLHLVINARVDSFLSSSFPDKPAAIEEAAIRAKAYRRAGADCIYPIGPGDEPTARELRKRIGCPINILASSSAAPLAVLQDIGVNRVSFGPFVFRACLRQFVNIVDALRSHGDCGFLTETLCAADVREYLSPADE
jgi:2-methylisocitrate lyase-like PEP mutase family enzyme